MALLRLPKSSVGVGEVTAVGETVDDAETICSNDAKILDNSEDVLTKLSVNAALLGALEAFGAFGVFGVFGTFGALGTFGAFGVLGAFVCFNFSVSESFWVSPLICCCNLVIRSKSSVESAGNFDVGKCVGAGPDTTLCIATRTFADSDSDASAW